MIHEKIFKRDDKSRVKITIRFSSDPLFEDYGGYTTNVHTCVKGKRAWIREYGIKQRLEHVTKEEILQAKLELWEKMKPTI